MIVLTSCFYYHSINKLKEQNEKLVDEVLGGSLRLLDLCNTFKDALQQTKESTQDLQSIIRRRRIAELNLSSEVKKFFDSRKTAKKALHRAMESKCVSSTLLNKDEEIVSMLREVQSITVVVFESMFSIISGPKSSSCSLFSKLINSKTAYCLEVNKANEFTSADAALSLLLSEKMKKSETKLKENPQNQLQALEMCIQYLEEGIESLYRLLIKTRVSLLNILNN